MANMKELLNELESRGYNENMLGQVLEEQKILEYEKMFNEGFNQGFFRGLVLSTWVVLIGIASYIMWLQ
jgi:hypothetical protein